MDNDREFPVGGPAPRDDEQTQAPDAFSTRYEQLVEQAKQDQPAAKARVDTLTAELDAAKADLAAIESVLPKAPRAKRATKASAK